MSIDVITQSILDAPILFMPEWATSLRLRFTDNLNSSFDPIDSIVWKIRLSRFYRREAFRVLSRENDVLLTSAEAIETFKLELEAFVAGYAHAIHSILDLTLQLINTCYLEAKIPKKKVNYNRIDAELRRKDPSSIRIAENLRMLTDAPEWVYINEFVSAVKHRRAIRSKRIFSAIQQEHAISNQYGYLGLFIGSLEVDDISMNCCSVRSFFQSKGEKVREMFDNFLMSLNLALP